MSDQIRSVLSPQFGDDWDRIFGSKPTNPVCTCGHELGAHLDGGCTMDATGVACGCSGFVEPGAGSPNAAGEYEGWR